LPGPPVRRQRADLRDEETRSAVTFGQSISEARKRKNMSQRQLAARIIKDDGRPISPQYLNDFERDRRTPSSDRLIEQLAEVLGISEYVLYHRAGEVPKDLRATSELLGCVVLAGVLGGPCSPAATRQDSGMTSSTITSSLSSVGFIASE
jgi:transcriptional regulator with XRE-family HTH domain